MPRTNSSSFSLEDDEAVVADPVLEEGRQLSSAYDKTANSIKDKYQPSFAQHHEQSSTQGAAAAPAVANAPPSLTERIAAGAKHGAEAIQHSLQHASAALKRTSSNAGGNEKEQPVPVSSQAASEHAQGEATSEVTTTATKLKEALQDLGKKTREASSAAYENLRRLAAQDRRIAVVCKQEFQQKPCPQTLLACCTVLVAKGLDTPSVFNTEAIPCEFTETHAALLGKSVLVPNSMDPVTAAAVIKHFLASLDEPLLTRKLADQWIAAGANPASAIMIMADLPLANLSALRVLMETCHRIATYSSAAGVDAESLAAELVPALLWRLPVTGNVAASAGDPSQPASMPALAGGSFMPSMNASIQALKSKLLSFKLGSADAAAQSAEAKEDSSTKEEDAMLDGSHSAADVASPEPDAETKSPKAAAPAVMAAEEQQACEKPKLTKPETEAVVRVVAHLIQHFDECFMTAQTVHA